MQDEFITNLLKLIASQQQVIISMKMSVDMFDKGYFSLGQLEKIAVDQAVFSLTATNFQNITPDKLKNPKLEKPVGFQSNTQSEGKP